LNFQIKPYQTSLESTWDQWCAGSVNGTFLHTRRFLSYHGNRFEDASVLIFESGELVGVFSAALNLGEEGKVISHPGATFGGIVHQGRLTGSRMVEAMAVICNYYAGQNYRKLLYKAIPYIYTLTNAQDDIYALFRQRAVRTRCDLSCAIDLAHRLAVSERRRRGLKKALSSVTLSSDGQKLNELWTVIQSNLRDKHDLKPVHSAEELALLQSRFPDQIFIRCALLDGKVEAGVVFFNSSRVWHAQYIASTKRGQEISALDAIFDAALQEAVVAGARYFNFGVCTEEDGRVLNEGLYRFKSEFGGGGVAYEFYEMDLK
jgi:hypothetical protein